MLVQSIKNASLLTTNLSDGKIAAKDIGDKVEGVGEKVQVVIDGARGLSNQLKTLPF